MKTAAPEKKSVKTLKGQLFGAVSMMLVAAIALGTSTYAWFINNRTVEVQNMKLEVSTSTSLLVAVGKQAIIDDPAAAANWTGFKSVIINDDITGLNSAADAADWKDFLSTRMTPASVSSFALTKAAPSFFLTDNHVANSKLDQFTYVENGKTVADVGQGPVKRIPLKFSASTGVDVYFGKGGLNGIADMITPAIVAGMTNPDTSAEYTADEIAASLAEATAIKRALRVAVVPKNDNTDYKDAFASAPIIFQFDAGTAIPTNGNNTDYQYITLLGQVYPSADNDTAANAGVVNDLLSAMQKPDAGKYAAIRTSDWDKTDPTNAAKTKHVLSVQLQQALVPGLVSTDPNSADTRWATVTVSGGTATVEAPAANAAEMFQLIADKPRQVDVYIWLEGADEDCLNALSGYDFNLALPFAAIDTEP